MIFSRDDKQHLSRLRERSRAARVRVARGVEDFGRFREIALTPALSRKRERGQSFHLSRLRERSRGARVREAGGAEDFGQFREIALTLALSRKRERGPGHFHLSRTGEGD